MLNRKKSGIKKQRRVLKLQAQFWTQAFNFAKDSIKVCPLNSQAIA